MKKMISFVFFLSFWIHSFAFAKQILSNKTIKQIESAVQKQMKDKNLTDEKKYYFYLLAGREFLSYNYLDYSQKYYDMALALKFKANHSEVYLKLLAIAVLKKKNIQKAFDTAKSYFNDHPTDLTGEMKDYLNFIEYSYLSKKTKELKDNVYKGFYGQYAGWQDVEDKIKSKSFVEALASLNPDGLQKADIGSKVTYDLLNVVVNHERASNLLCDETYQKYPNAYSYSMMICGSLKKYLKEKKLSKNDLKALEDYFKENHQEKNYLLIPLRELAI
jgi:hypothetical protein